MARVGLSLLLIGVGAAIGLGQLPFGLPWVALAALVLVMATGLPARPLAAFGRGWAVGFGYFLLTLHWITQPFLVDAGRDGWMAPFGLIFMTGGLALFWGAAFAFAVWLGGGSSMRRAVALVACWSGAEMLRSYVFTGFPWALVGHIWIDAGLAQTARLWGAHGLTLMTLAVAGLTASRLWQWRRPTGWALIALPPAALLAVSLILDPRDIAQAEPDAPLIRIVQPNVPQADKSDPEAMPGHFRRMLELTAAPVAADARAPALVVWPETAIPWPLDLIPDLLAMMADAGGAPVAVGVQRSEGPFYYNSLAVIGDGGAVDAVYDKHHLVPFGEYVPLGDLLGRWGIRGLAAAEGGGYAPGAGPDVIEIAGIGTAMPLICYEGIFAQEVNATPARPRFLLLITNDAWFGTFAGPYQHFALGRLRAIEQGLPMVRAANTGVSAMIDGRGRVIGSLDLGVAGVLDLPLPPALAPPPYVGLGDWPVACVIAALIAGLVVLRRRMPIDPVVVAP